MARKTQLVTLHDARGRAVALLSRAELDQLLREGCVAEHGTMGDEFGRRYRITKHGRKAAEGISPITEDAPKRHQHDD